MATRMQIDRLAQRIEALNRLPRIGFIWGERNETVAEARERHARLYPEDDAANMLVMGWEPMAADEWQKTYCVPDPPRAG